MTDPGEIRSPDPRDYYADGVYIGVAPYGFVLDFALSRAPGPGEALTDVESDIIARVRMSPQLAYVFSTLLAANVAAYEEQIGKIDIPGSLQGLSSRQTLQEGDTDG